jgi:hypothetical protein
MRTVKKWAVVLPSGVIDRRGASGCRAVFDRKCEAADHAQFAPEGSIVVPCSVTYPLVETDRRRVRRPRATKTER